MHPTYKDSTRQSRTGFAPCPTGLLDRFASETSSTVQDVGAAFTSKTSTRQSRTCFVLVVSAFLLFSAATRLTAGTINWDGDNGVGNFSYDNNWYGDSNPNSFGGWVSTNDLQFNLNNGGATSLYWDYGGWRDIGKISFMSTFTGPITWNGDGNGLNFNQIFENLSSYTITVGSMNLSAAKFGATQIEFNPVNGDIVLNGNVYNDTNKPYFVFGNNGKTLTVNTVLSGTTAAFTDASNNIVIFTASQAITGDTTIKAGRIELAATGGVAGAIKLGDTTGTAAAELRLTDSDGGFLENAAITVNTGSSGIKTISSTNTSGTNTLSGTIALSDAVTFNVTDSGGTLAATGVISSTGAVTKTGPGTLTLSASNTFTGALTVQTGTLAIPTINPVSANGTLGNSATAVTLGSNGATGTLEYTGATASSSKPFAMATSGTGAFQIDTVGTTLTLSGIISGSGNLTKSGAGSLTLGTTASTYTGDTTFSAGTVNIGGSGTPLGSTATPGTLRFSGGTLNVTSDRGTSTNSLTNNVVVTADSTISTTSATAGSINVNFSTGTLTGTGGTLTFQNASTSATNIFDPRFSGGDFTMARPIVLTNSASGGTTRLTDANATGTTHTYDGAISGNGSFRRLTGAAGTTIFNATNTYTGTTVIGGGTLLVNGSTAAASAVTVNSSGTTLGGIGTINGTVTLGNTAAGAILNPGPKGTAGTSGSVGTLTTGALTLTGANTVHIDAFGTSTSQWDKLISGAISLGTTSTLDVTIASGLTFTAGTTYILLDGTGLTGTFSGIADNQLVTFSGYGFTADYTTTGFDLIAVPEPSTWIGGALALGTLAFTQLRKRSRAGSSAFVKRSPVIG